MSSWSCGIEGCGRRFGDLGQLIRHQAVDHPSCECAVCGRVLPNGYLSIRHAFAEHTRAEYVRAYDADADEIRIREELIDYVEDRIDVPTLVSRIEADDEPAVSVSD